YAAITTALYHRERTGKGANVGTSLLATGVWATGTLVSAALAGAKPYERDDQFLPKRRRPLDHAGREAVSVASTGQRDGAVGPVVRSALFRRKGPRPARHGAGRSACRRIPFPAVGALERGSRRSPAALRRHPVAGRGGGRSAAPRRRHRGADRGR